MNFDNLSDNKYLIHLELTFKDKLKLIYRLFTQKVIYIPIDYTSNFVYDILEYQKKAKKK
ncbi:MAG: hypothetical protein WC307_05090 [Candidatus Nanoarchaeia archaeon]|jgi:CRISPR/Cas system-associated protein Cas5 (RAMP superfamily)